MEFNMSGTASITRIYSAPNDFNTVESCVFGLATVCISIFTVVSNATVIYITRASSEMKSLGCLRFLIGSMAWADLLLGLIVMPLAAQYSLLQEWHLGEFGCRTFACVEVFCGTSTALHLCAIAIERYLAILHPVTYKNIGQSYSRGAIRLSWLTSCLMCASMVVFDMHEYKIVGNQHQCESPEHSLMAVLIFAVIIGIPYCVIWIIYIVLYCTSRNRLKNRMGKAVEVYQHITLSRSKIGSNDGIKKQQNDDIIEDVERIRIGCFPYVSRGPFTTTKACLGCQANVSVSYLKSGLCNVCRSPNDLIAAAVESRIRILMRQNRKALFVTLVITCTFSICYAPIGIQYQLGAICPTCQTLPRLTTALVWLGRGMSALNPIIYGLFNNNFRRAFKKLFE